MSIPCWRPEDIRSLKRVKGDQHSKMTELKHPMGTVPDTVPSAWMWTGPAKMTVCHRKCEEILHM